MAKKSIMGRPRIIDKDTLQKLEYGFSIGCGDVEACLYAGISKSTLYNYQRENPDFVNRKEQLKDNVVLKARLAVESAIEKGDAATARWYLERKRKEEFSTKHELDSNVSVRVEKIFITAEEQKEVDDHIKDVITNG